MIDFFYLVIPDLATSVSVEIMDFENIFNSVDICKPAEFRIHFERSSSQYKFPINEQF